jgi:hypothetical protein
MRAVVTRRGYSYAGTEHPVGAVLEMTDKQFKASQEIIPPYLERATEADGDARADLRPAKHDTPAAAPKPDK